MRLPVSLLAAALIGTQCAGALAAEYRASSHVFGTLARMTVLDADLGRAQRATAGVFREFDRMHRDLHAWQPGELTALNEAIARGEKDIATTAEITGLIEEATRLSERSAGLFNPAIGKLVALWSFHRDQPGGPLPDPTEIARVVEAHPRMADLAVRGRTVRSSNPQSGSISAATRRATRSIAPQRSYGIAASPTRSSTSAATFSRSDGTAIRPGASAWRILAQRVAGRSCSARSSSETARRSEPPAITAGTTSWAASATLTSSIRAAATLRPECAR